MKCPKCGYLGFESVERCRNCGYDFALAPAREPLALSLRSEEQLPRSADDLTLDVSQGESQAGPPVGTDLPLFGSSNEESEVPVVARPSRPRQPLAVRRATPEAVRLRTPQARPPTLNLEPSETTHPSDSAELRSLQSSVAVSQDDRAPVKPDGLNLSQYALGGPPEDLHGIEQAEAPPRLAPATIGQRSMAAAIDIAVLALVDGAVLYFTLRILGFTMADLGLLPVAPLIMFLLTLNGGYLVVFNASGQTIGKMVTRIQVVSMQGRQVDLLQATLRTAVWLLLVAPAGLGVLSVLLSQDGQGFHDRFAGTRVIRAR